MIFLFFVILNLNLTGAELECHDTLENTPLAYAVDGGHNSCALMLIQKEANINVKIHKHMESIRPSCVKRNTWKYFLEHWKEDQIVKEKQPISLFEKIVDNNWLGITYIVLGKLEKFGFSIARAIEVAFKLGKFQFAKTLLSRTIDVKKLKEIVNNRRNLIGSFAFYCNNNVDKELVEDIYTILTEADLQVDQKDDCGCVPLHSASLLHNETLVGLLMRTSQESVSILDNYGRSPLDAYFWNFEKGLLKDDQNKILDKMFENGAHCNNTFQSKPMDFLLSRYESQFKDIDFYCPDANLYMNTPNSTQNLTPLMIAMGHKDHEMTEYLISNGADLNLSDSVGRTAPMIALKTNDKKILDCVLKNQNLNMASLDDYGSSIIDHAIAFEPNSMETFSFDNDTIMKELMKLDFGKSVMERGLQRAKEMGANSCAKILSSKLGKKLISFHPKPTNLQMDFCISSKFDHKKDSALMMNIKELEVNRAAKKGKQETPIPKGCTIKNGSIVKDFDILLNKVDVQYSQNGLYNFYRLQIWKDAHKELFVLFTNWGRIDRYMNGQYQNTPFSKEEEAIEEFKKIFKSKTGNEWSNKESFEEKPKKYRIVQAEHASTIKRPSFEINLMTKVESKLPPNFQLFMKDISETNMFKLAYKNERLVDTSSIPFERITKEAIEKAQGILAEIRKQIEKISKLQLNFNQLKSNNDKDTEKYNRLFFELFTSCCKLSNEYYSLVPTFGFEFEKVPPIDNDHILEQEENKMKYLQEFETAKSFLLGAMYRKDEIHPLDYVFGSLSCKIVELNEHSKEGKWIQKYMYNSKGMSSRKIENIFKVEREEDSNKLKTSSQQGNRKLLWHGTNTSNIISILKNGMLLDAPFANKTGRSYGDGIYFADILDKSLGYSNGDYLLLCDVELGSCKVSLITQKIKFYIFSL